VFGSNGPDLNLLGDNAPVRLVVVRRNDVQIVGVFLDQLIQLALSENVVVPVERDRPAPVLGQGLLRRGQTGVVALQRLLRFHGRVLADQHGRAPRVGLLRRRPTVAARLPPVREPRVLAAVAPGRQRRRALGGRVRVRRVVGLQRVAGPQQRGLAAGHRVAAPRVALQLQRRVPVLGRVHGHAELTRPETLAAPQHFVHGVLRLDRYARPARRFGSGQYLDPMVVHRLVLDLRVRMRRF